MKSAKHLLAALTLIAVSSGVCIPRPSRSWDQAGLNLCGPESILSTEWSGRTKNRFTIQTNPDIQEDAVGRDKVLVKRTEYGQDPPVSKDPRRVATPSLGEAKSVLSPEEYKRYEELLVGRRAYYNVMRKLKQAKNEGREPTADEIKTHKESLPKMSERQQLDRVVRQKLIESGKARAETKELDRTKREKKTARDEIYRNKPEIKGRRRARYEAKKKQQLGSPNKEEAAVPTAEEAKEVLSPADSERYTGELLQGRRAYYRALRAKRNAEAAGLEPSDKVIAALNKNRPLLRERLRLEGVVKKKLVEQGKAREKTVTQVDRDREAKRRRDRMRREKKKHQQQGSIVLKPKASSPEEASTSTSVPDSTAIESGPGGVEDLHNNNPLQLISKPVSYGARHAVENLREKWQAVPWSSFLPRQQKGQTSPWAINGPVMVRPVMPAIL
ncbi:MAG: hypothetical protein M1816_006423 [Peltula sp. TS41687]|nr:MAG: hypothetical protein M1816_006423 [Peltula sp. TS41687]